MRSASTKFARPVFLAKPSKGVGGIALLFVLVAMFAISAVAIQLNARADQSSQLSDAQSAQLLAQARSALIGQTLLNTQALIPPFPDIASEAIPNYSGVSNNQCTTTAGVVAANCEANRALRIFGRLPWRSLGLDLSQSPSNTAPASDADQIDSRGRIAWLAVSLNMVDTKCSSQINPRTTSYAFDITSTCTDPLKRPYHPWLTVRDWNGQIVTDRAAMVIILPGAPIGAQVRTPAPAAPTQFLDSFTVTCGAPACVPGTYDNAARSTEFIMSPDNRPVRNAAGDIIFNDRIAYVTIDELMSLATRMVANAMQTHYVRYGVVPWLAPLNSLVKVPANLDTLVSPYAPPTPSSLGGTTLGFIPGAQPAGTQTVLVQSGFNWTITPAGAYTTQQAVAGSNITPAVFAGYLSGSATANNGVCAWTSRAQARRVDCTLSVTTGLPPGIVLRTVRIRWIGPSATIAAQTATAESRASVTTTQRLTTPAGVPSLEIRDYTAAGVASLTAAETRQFSDPIVVNGTMTANNIVVNPDLPTWYWNQGWAGTVVARIAPQFATPGVQTCTLGTCMSLTKNLVTQYPDASGARAAIVLMTYGKALTGQIRSPDYPNSAASLVNFFEGTNATPLGGAFERRMASATFNDQVECSYSPVANQLNRCTQ